MKVPTGLYNYDLILHEIKFYSQKKQTKRSAFLKYVVELMFE